MLSEKKVIDDDSRFNLYFGFLTKKLKRLLYYFWSNAIVCFRKQKKRIPIITISNGNSKFWDLQNDVYVKFEIQNVMSKSLKHTKTMKRC